MTNNHLDNRCWNSIGRRLALGAVALLAFASSVLAADRVLLGPRVGIPLAAQTNAQTANTLGRLRTAAASTGSVRLIVGLRAAFAPEPLLSTAVAAQQRRDIAQMRAAVLAKLPSVAARPEAVKQFDTIPFVGLTVTAQELEALANMAEVTSIHEDALAAPTLLASVPHIGGNAAWLSGYTGAGQAVAVLDTGVDKNHPFLAGKVISEACYSTTWSGDGAYSICPGGASSSTAPDSALPCATGCNHGTHVAGIVAGNNGPVSAPAGVAKDAGIIAIQVFSIFYNPVYCNGAASCVLTYDSDQLRGLERVYALRGSYNIASVNMSLGGGRYYDQATCDGDNPAQKTAIDNLRAAGIATVISSGNSGYVNSLGAPACISSAISVGSTWARMGYTNSCLGYNLPLSSLDSISCFSNSASFLNLLAPGSGIWSSIPGASYAEFYGTSMAAPHVAGAWAVMKQKKPNASVTEVLNTFVSTGVSVTDPRNGITKKRINLQQAVASIGTQPQQLTVSKAGGGSVSSNPAGIDCGATCSAQFAEGTSVALTAAPAAGYSFAGWSGDCSGSGICTVSMTAARAVTATFSPAAQVTLSIVKSGSGTGTVTRSGGSLNCGSVCSESLAAGSLVTLVAAPAAGSIFAGWSGPCSGTGICTFNISANTIATASFSSASGGTVTALSQPNLSASAGSTQNFSLSVPSGATNLVVQISGGTGDADLYVRAAQVPTLSAYDCRPRIAGNEETCSFATPIPGTYYIMLNAFASYSGVTLTASYRLMRADITQIINLLLF